MEYGEALEYHKQEIIKHAKAYMAIVKENTEADYKDTYQFITDRIEITIEEIENMPFSDSIEIKEV